MMRSALGIFIGALAFMCTACCCVAVPAFSLSGERHYEMVSPVFKGGFSADKVEGVATDGNSVAFYSGGGFNGAPAGLDLTGVDYLAHRTSSSWATDPTMAPAALIAEPLAGDMTPSLERVFEMGHPGANTFNPVKDEQDLWLHSTDLPDVVSAWQLGDVLELLSNEPERQFRPAYRSASVDFCHLLFSPSETDPLVEEAVGTREELYEVDRCGGSPAPRLVGIDNKGHLIAGGCPTTFGAEHYGLGGKDTFNAISADGQEVFFTVCPTGNEAESHQVFVRLAGSKTLEVSRPLQPACEREGVAGEVPCQGAGERDSASFVGASEDGSRVYFTARLANSGAPLVPGDSDTSNNLYVATIGCAGGDPACGPAEREVTTLKEVSHDANAGQAAEVMGAVRVAPDGERAYFVAAGDLLSEAQRQELESNGGALPQAGADNLYVYDAISETVDFIGDLCSSSGLSGTVEDGSCPGAGGDERLWTVEEGEAQTAGPDGQFLVFASNAQLTQGDTNTASDIYRYDANSKALSRVSLGENGFDDNGNRVALDKEGKVLGARIAPGHYGGHLREQHEMNNRAISEDGSRIVFTSAEPLSPSASNSLLNAYEWRANGGEGSVSLVSTGSAEEPVSEAVISPAGNDIFFVTSQGLVPQDTDGEADIYDARIGAGFPEVEAVPQACSGDACQGPLTNPVPVPAPGTVAQAPGNNFSPPVTSKAKRRSKTARCKKGYVKKKKKCVKVKKKHARKSNRGRGK